MFTQANILRKKLGKNQELDQDQAEDSDVYRIKVKESDIILVMSDGNFILLYMYANYNFPQV